MTFPTRPLRYTCFLWCALVGLWLTAALAEAQGPWAGDYRASPQRIEAQVSTWGEDCGPRPQNVTLDEKVVVKVSQEGAHLVLRYPDRTLRTNGCWSPNPAVKLLSTSAANGRFRAECATGEGDAKREAGRYTVVASAGKLELVEESDYNWQLKSSRCDAKVRMTQTLVPGDQPEPAVSEVASEPAPSACVPGDPVRIRLRPAEARITPGQRVCFTARGFDAAGCARDLPASAVSFGLNKPSGADGSLTGACFRAATSAALGEGVFKVVASGNGMRSEATVTVSAVDLSDITARRGPSAGDAAGQGVFSGETVFESGVRAVASGSHGLLWLGLTLAAIAGVLSTMAIVALRLVRRRQRAVIAASARRSVARASAAQPAGPTPSAPARPVLAAAPPTESGPPRICPRCRRGYAPMTARCAIDGELLLDYADFVKRAEVGSAPRHCPQCGEQAASGAVFCGRCGGQVEG